MKEVVGGRKAFDGSVTNIKNRLRDDDQRKYFATNLHSITSGKPEPLASETPTTIGYELLHHTEVKLAFPSMRLNGVKTPVLTVSLHIRKYRESEIFPMREFEMVKRGATKGARC